MTDPGRPSEPYWCLKNPSREWGRTSTAAADRVLRMFNITP